ncbi:MAG TPA: alkaline phosphatase [Prolixibacteraceae bacterium]|nr:alkaline phosphatase [Prolixibacteraceae bacterium]HCU63736.1 alkaline phosphatase [Prolixibacteraceae bacterium]
MKTQLISKLLTGLLLTFSFGVFNSQAGNKQKNLPHVLVIGIDGLGAHGIGMAKTPNLDELMKNGSYSLAARTVVPSSSGPAWSSMITGTTVERHGIGNNEWTVDHKILEPVFKGEFNMFPTIFGETRKHLPQATIGVVYHWGAFGNFVEKGVCDLSIPCNSESAATQKACDFLAEKRPHFTFVHLDLVDHGGHHGGYRSDEYVKSVEKADSLVGVFTRKLKELEMLDKTVIFILSDHGGLEKKHGGITPDEMIVPFIISGKGVKKGYEMKRPVFTYDLVPTIAWLFGFQLNEWVTGKPLVDAFAK